MTPDQQKEATVIALFEGKKVTNDWMVEAFSDSVRHVSKFRYHTNWNQLHSAWNKFRRVRNDDFQYNSLCVLISNAIANEDTPENAAGLLGRGIEFINSIK